MLFVPLAIMSQDYNKTRTIKLNYPLQDFSRKTKNLEVVDNRPKQEIGEMVFRGNYYAFAFPSNNAKVDIEKWYHDNNKKTYTTSVNDIVLVIDQFNISSTSQNNTVYCNLSINAATFVKTENGYRFLSRFDDVLGVDSKQISGLPSLFQENIAKILQKLISDSYKAKPSDVEIPTSELKNYETILKASVPAFANSSLKDGVYPDFQSFFQQIPLQGYQMQKVEGQLYDKAINLETKFKLPNRKIYAYIENGKAFKNTAIGFREIQKDTDGFYLLANRGILFPEEFNISVWYFVAGGLIGGAIGGTIEAINNNAKMDKAQASEKSKVYIDPFMGTYSFSQ